MGWVHGVLGPTQLLIKAYGGPNPHWMDLSGPGTESVFVVITKYRAFSKSAQDFC